jgi:hypothetical protein
MKSLFKPALFACGLSASVLLASACDSSGSKGPGDASPRKQWLEHPSSGSQNGDRIKIPGLAVSFERPPTLYVFKECRESSHSAAPPNEQWIPIVECAAKSGGALDTGGEDEFSGGDSSSDTRGISPLTFYVGPKDMVINERTVETLKLQYQSQGWSVEEIGYHGSYMDKPKRAGIAMRVVLPSTGDEEGVEIQRFMWPVDDVLFIAETRYAPGTDRSGMNFDWKRILWNFQLDEDGPLFADG